jgi:MFS family permease
LEDDFMSQHVVGSADPQAFGSEQATFTTKVALGLLAVVIATYVVNGMDRLLYPQLVPYINKHFAFSLIQGGLLSTIFTLGMGIGGIPAGYLIDHVGRKSSVIIGMVVYSIFTLTCAYAVNFWDLAGYRILTGVGEAVQQAALYTLVGAYFYRNRCLAFGSLNFAYGIGAFVGPVFGMKIFLATGQQWQMPLVVFAILGIAVCAVFWVFVPKAFTEFKGIGKAADEIIEEHLPHGLLTRNLVLVSIVNIMVGFSNFSYMGMYPTFLKTSLQYDPSTAALCAGMYGIGAFMGIPAGYMSDRLNQRWIVIAAVFGTMVSGYLMFNVVTAWELQVVLSFLYGTFGSGFLFVNIYALSQRSVKKEFLGRASGIASSAHYLPAAFAGMLFGWLVTIFGGWGTAGFILWVLFPLISLGCMFLFQEKAINIIKR